MRPNIDGVDHKNKGPAAGGGRCQSLVQTFVCLTNELRDNFSLAPVCYLSRCLLCSTPWEIRRKLDWAACGLSWAGALHQPDGWVVPTMCMLPDRSGHSA